ncbi:MAG: phosphate acyltransferase [Bryobacteraceae bacterium]|jgi:phosphate acetyltransferase
MNPPESARLFLERQMARLRAQPKRRRIVFPEGDDPRILEAAARLRQDGLIEPILICRPGTPSGMECVEPSTSPRLKAYARILYERRHARGMTETEAQRAAQSSLVFAGLMVAAGDADAFVGGAATTTAETFRAAITTIGTRPGTRTVSGVMIVCVYDQVFGASGVIAMADPALIIDPSATQLAEIAIATAETTRTVIGAEPAVALLSFSTKGSAEHPWVEKVREARRVVEARAPQLHIDGELQADAALVEAVGRSKAPGSTVAGHANTLIFPDVASANIGVKLVERLGGAVNTGPFFQGLAKPANDLPRGCSPEDVYRVAIVTALQCG